MRCSRKLVLRSVPVVVFSLVFLNSAANAAQPSPFEVANLNPLIQIFGLPIPSTPQALVDERVEFRLQQEVANSFSIQRSGTEATVIDGEIWRTTLGVGYGLSAATRLDLRIPMIRHSDGILDGLIGDWHEGLGLPNGDREDRPEDSLLYAYQSGTDVLANYRSREQGIGDVRLSLTQAVPFSKQDAFISAAVKLPTGDIDKLTGSGATDWSLSAMLRDSNSLAGWNLAWFGGGAIAYLGSADNSLSRRQNDWVWSTHLGGAWAARPNLHIKAQLDHHTAVYDSDVKALGSQALQLTAGLSWLPAATVGIDFAISEDLITTITPDISILAGLNYRF